MAYSQLVRVLHAGLGYRDPITDPEGPEVSSQSPEHLRTAFRRWLTGPVATRLILDPGSHGPLATALAGFASKGIILNEVRLYAASKSDPDISARLAAAQRLLPLAFPEIRFTTIHLGAARVFDYQGAFDALARHWSVGEGEETHILVGPGTPQLNSALVFRAAARRLPIWQVTTPKKGPRLESVGPERYLREVRFGEGALPPIADAATTMDIRARAAEAELDRIAASGPDTGDERLDYRSVLDEYERTLWAKAALREALAARREGRQPSTDRLGDLLGCSGQNVRRRLKTIGIPWPPN